jgi:hypothetical protein
MNPNTNDYTLDNKGIFGSDPEDPEPLMIVNNATFDSLIWLIKIELSSSTVSVAGDGYMSMTKDSDNHFDSATLIASSTQNLNLNVSTYSLRVLI